MGGWREEATAAGRERSSAKLLSGPQRYFRVKSVNASYRRIEVKIYFVTVCLLFSFCYIRFSSWKEPIYAMNQITEGEAQLNPG